MEDVVDNSTKINIKDDYYLFINKDKILFSDLDDGKQSTDLASVSINYRTDRVYEMLQGYKGNPSSNYSKNVINLYRLVSDWEERDSIGVKPLYEIIDFINEISSISDMSALFCKQENFYLLNELFGLGVSHDNTDNSGALCILIAPSRFLLPSSAYSSLTNDELLMINLDLQRYVFRRLEYTENQISDLFKSAFSFERDLSLASSMDMQQNVSLVNTSDHYLTKDGIKELQNEFDFYTVIQSLFETNEDTIFLVEQLSWFRNLNEKICMDNLEQIKAYLLVKTVNMLIQLLDRPCVSKTISTGEDLFIEDSYSNREIISNTVFSLLPWSTSCMYVEQYDYKNYQNQISSLKDSIVNSFIELLKLSNNISYEEKEFFIQKIDNMFFYLLFPERWDLYLDNDILIKTYNEGENLVSAYIKCMESSLNRTQKAFSTQDKNYWKWSPLEFKGGYMYNWNAVVLTIGLVDSVWSPACMFEESLATCGFFIAHEIAHLFNAQLQYADSNQKTSNSINEKLVKLADSISGISLFPNYIIDGDVTCEETLADIIAVQCLLNLAHNNPEFDYELFFSTYADMFCAKYSEEVLNEYIYYNRHLLPLLRVNFVLQQFEDFIEYFEVMPGDGMYRSEDKRITMF